MHVLVTGAGGFCGRHLVSHLFKKGCRVTAVYRSHVPPCRCAWVPLDIRDAGAVNRLIEKTRPDAVCHLAAQSVPRFSWAHEEETFEANVGGTIHLLDALRRYRPRARFLFVSSNQVYGRSFRSGRAVKETDLLWPENPYAASKAAAEFACLDFGLRFDIDIVIARAFNHLGTGQETHFVFSDWCRQIALAEAGKRPRVLEVGNLEALRDFLHVADVVRAYAVLLARGKKGSVYNVCTGKTHALTEYVDFLLKEARVPLKVVVKAKRLRRFDPPVMWGHPGRLNKLGWRPLDSPFQALKELLDEWRGRVA